MGREVASAVSKQSDMRLLAGVDKKASASTFSVGDGSVSVPLFTDLPAALSKHEPQVMVDFTAAEAVMPAARLAAKQGVSLVIGTTGYEPADIQELEKLAASNGIGIVVAANFALGAVLMMHLARQAARHFDYAEVIELHHETKADAPSGTAVATAKAMVEARGKPFLRNVPQRENLPGARNAESGGVTVHSIRLPGLVAHQEVIFGGMGQTLTIRHDTIGRECYMPGVLIAARHVASKKGLVQGLDKLLGL